MSKFRPEIKFPFFYQQNADFFCSYNFSTLSELGHVMTNCLKKKPKNSIYFTSNVNLITLTSFCKSFIKRQENHQNMIESAKFSINKDDFIHKYFVIVLPSKQRNSSVWLQKTPRFLALIAKNATTSQFLSLETMNGSPCAILFIM